MLNILRPDDLICGLPPKWMGFVHVAPVGHVMPVNPEGVHGGGDHATENDH